MGCVYLIHFMTRYHHAGHYVGLADDVEERLNEHEHTSWTREALPDGSMRGVKKGLGATLLGVVNSAGIPWKLARVWPDADRELESRIKRNKNTPRLCPICNLSAYHHLASDAEEEPAALSVDAAWMTTAE